MVLVDTSVWIHHFRSSLDRLKSYLLEAQVMVHPFVIGELACGNLKNRSEILSLLKSLPSTSLVKDDDILFFIERQNLMGRGLGLIDIHLLASAKLAHVSLWTEDKKLDAAARGLDLSI